MSYKAHIIIRHINVESLYVSTELTMRENYTKKYIYNDVCMKPSLSRVYGGVARGPE